MDVTSGPNEWANSQFIFSSFYRLLIIDQSQGSVVILPDQAQILNPLIIVTLIPLFEATLYPCLRYFKLNFRYSLLF